MIRNCPVCRHPLITRADMKTCGSPSCMAEWRSYTGEMKMQARDRAALNNSELLEAIQAMSKSDGKAVEGGSEAADVSASDFTKRILGE